jgi:hypothetical protein
VCDDSFNDHAAAVACRTLGYSTGTMINNTDTPDGTGPIVLDDISCDGTESSLFDCDFNVLTGNCTHSEDVGVSCS